MKAKRILSLLLVVVLVLAMLPTAVFANDETAIQIASAADLPTEISAGSTYELTADITLASGQQIETLAGTLDGKGHTVTLADKPLANTVTGTIQNLGVQGTDTVTLSGVSGSMAVTLSGTIQNCYSLVNMTTSGWDDIGGLVGTLSGGKIYNSYYAGTNSAMFADGLVGSATGGEIANSYYTVGFSAIGMGGSKVTQTNVAKMSDMTGIAAVEALNTDISPIGYIWAQDTESTNSGFPILTEDTGDTSVNKTALEAKITAAKALPQEAYTTETWTALTNALDSAEDVLGKDDATQSEVNFALSALEAAINALEKKKPVEPVSSDGYTVKHITTQAELEAIGAGNADTYYILDNDITFDGWYMSFSTFNGVFDGNGKTITFQNDYTGLFKNIGSNGVVQNVHFAGVLKSSADYGACAQEVQGAVINCYTEVAGGSASGFAKRLNGGILSNCYSISEATDGAILEQTETPDGTPYTGTLRNVYWRSDLSQPVDLTKLTTVGEVKALDASAMKSLDFVAALNANKGTYGIAWGQSSNGYPYFGEDQTYVPEEENKVSLSENKTAIAFTAERTQATTVIDDQDLQIDIHTALNGIAGLFSLPEYVLQEGERIEWSASQQSPADVASVGSEYPYLSVEKEGVLVVSATLVKADSSTEVLACTKVTIRSDAIAAIRLYLAEYEDTENGEEIIDGKATVSGSESMRILVKALYTGESSYQTVSESDFTFTVSDPDGIVKHSEGSSAFSFRAPGTATMTVTHKTDSTLTADVALTSVYVPVTAVVPGVSGTVELHGRNGNSASGEDFLPDYANVVVTPANASYADSYTITGSDPSVAEYVTSMVYGYVPYKAGTVTYTATINDNGTVVSGDSAVTYVYKNPLKNVTAEKDSISMTVGDTTSAGLLFEGTLTDGHEVTETGMHWSFSTDGIVSVSRGNGAWKRDTGAPDDGSYFLSSAYTIRALSAGTVTVTGTPVDTTGGAQPISFTVTVSAGEEKAPDIYKIISESIATSEKYLREQLTELHADGGISYGFEWYITALLRAGKDIDDDILDAYYEAVVAEVKTYTADVKPTDAERTALALTIMGKDITNVDGVDLTAWIYNSTKLADGSNELAYALLALDAADAAIPETTVWDREEMITELLKFQSADGGFGLHDNAKGDVDMTAICLQALAPYQTDETVAASVAKALAYLKDAISSDYDYADNSNSTAQVLLALAALKIDVTAPDNGFGGAYYNIITALEAYRNADGNGYLYEDKVNSMATVQVMQAYDAYRKAHKESISYWDFTVAGEAYDDANTGNGSSSDNKAADPAIVYVTIASDGTIVTDKDGGYMAQVPVTVTDRDKNGVLTVDETLYAAHETHYQGGADAGYSSYTGAYGLSLAILWGKGTAGTSATAGYWLNNVSCWSLADAVQDGDHLTAFNYYDAVYWSDAYAYFTANEVSVTAGNSVNLQLRYLSGYDADNGYAPIFSAYSGATVVFLGSNNSMQKALTTDADGNVRISFSGAASTGTYYVMAYADDGSLVPAVCKICVTAASSGGAGSGDDDSFTVYIRVADPKGKTYLSKKAYKVEDGDSVYDLLEKTGLDIEITRSAYGVYINAIEGLAEFDEGAESGWMYRVNKKFPNYSASLYTLSKGDYVEWLYTRDLGADIGDNSDRGSLSDASTGTYTVKFETNGGSAVSSQKVEKNDTATVPDAPTKDGYTFGGWYTDKDLTDAYDFDTKVKKSFTLYAKWTAKAAFGENTFSDIGKNDWYYTYVQYVYENGLMQGTDNGFAPDSNMTRAMLVTVLYRLDGAQAREDDCRFTDVAEGEWYADAVAWADANGIVVGISDTLFAPNENITREQMAAVIYRYAKFKGYDVSDEAELSAFADTDAISDWALDALAWANAKELVKGTTDTTVSPKDTATRAQVAAILMRFCENIAK